MTNVLGPPRTVIDSIYDVTPHALEEIAMWLESRGIRVPISNIPGFSDLLRVSTSVYTTYTPTWTSTGTAPAIGNSTVVARYLKFGKHVHCFGSIIFGNTATFGTGNYSFALPVTASSNMTNSLLGTGYVLDASTGNYGAVVASAGTTTTMGLLYGATYLGTVTQAGQLAPWTWAVSDQIGWNLTYEAA